MGFASKRPLGNEALSVGCNPLTNLARALALVLVVAAAVGLVQIGRATVVGQGERVATALAASAVARGPPPILDRPAPVPAGSLATAENTGADVASNAPMAMSCQCSAPTSGSRSTRSTSSSGRLPPPSASGACGSYSPFPLYGCRRHDMILTLGERPCGRRCRSAAMGLREFLFFYRRGCCKNLLDLSTGQRTMERRGSWE